MEPKIGTKEQAQTVLEEILPTSEMTSQEFIQLHGRLSELTGGTITNRLLGSYLGKGDWWMSTNISKNPDYVVPPETALLLRLIVETVESTLNR